MCKPIDKNIQPVSVHQQLANKLAPKYTVYNLNRGIGVAKGDLEPLNADDVVRVKQRMRIIGLPVK